MAQTKKTLTVTSYGQMLQRGGKGNYWVKYKGRLLDDVKDTIEDCVLYARENGFTHLAYEGKTRKIGE